MFTRLPSFNSCTIMSSNESSLDHGRNIQAEKLTVSAGAGMTSKFCKTNSCDSPGHDYTQV